MCRGLIVVVASLMLLGCEHFEPCENFAAVSSGMSREQVTELVGAPWLVTKKTIKKLGSIV